MKNFILLLLFLGFLYYIYLSWVDGFEWDDDIETVAHLSVYE